MKVSVIILVYNQPELMKKTLLSLNCQSLLPSEVIVTDDGSDKNIVGELKDLHEKLNFKIKYVRQEHKDFRAAKARNNGVRAAENEYLVFYDQDIISTKNYLRTFVDHASSGRFIVSYPVRLTALQSKAIHQGIIESYSYGDILLSGQVLKIKKQFLKDYHSYLKKRWGFAKKGPKLRSGVFGLYKENFVKVNGFNEFYKGWGNEDDDLGNRLYAAGINGYNPFWNEYPLHLYHEANHEKGKRVNAKYYKEQKKRINETNYVCEFGYNNPLGEEKIEIIEFKKS